MTIWKLKGRSWEEKGRKGTEGRVRAQRSAFTEWGVHHSQE